MGIDFKKLKGLKADKFITIILMGILVLVVLSPTKNEAVDKTGVTGETEKESSQVSEYYENKLDAILEKSYGEGTMEVMVHLSKEEDSGGLYGTSNEKVVVDGVLIVADVKNETAVSDITYAVSALFGLPTHKVAVMIKK
ncbi:MAG: hypothetical protein NC225_08130 [Clostridium sp.]|nr:hypothetical protein [Clostridium sp.]MCM1399430.1 hypothetical protein [Clostridium sp.]MCM1459984.1 hypothetical protein [Bacteroides sp.]